MLMDIKQLFSQKLLTKNITLLIAATTIGCLYFTYLSSVDFPPVWVRLVPFVWLVTSALSIWFSIVILRSKVHKLAGFISLLAGLVNLLVALVFALAAVMGD